MLLLTAFLVSLGKDGELPETEDFVWETIGFLTMGIPLARDVARDAQGMMSGKGYGGRMGGGVGFAGFEAAVGATWQPRKYLAKDEEEAAEKAVREMVNVMGFASGIGTPQLWRTWMGSEAFFVDGEGGPLAPLIGTPKGGKD